MSTRMERAKDGPYGEMALYYIGAGWPQTLPIWKGGARDKQPMLSGYHGRNGTWPDDTTLRLWASRYRTANVALRLPRGVIGLDVDHYDSKYGGDGLAVLEEGLGPLPLTVVSTSRTDGVSGIRLFQVPDEYVDAEWPGQADPDIDVITWYERYVICAPSVHARGGVYTWYRQKEDGDWVVMRRVPRPEALPVLPESWCEHLKALAWNSSARWEGAGYDGDAVTWLRDYGGGRECGFMSARAVAWVRALRDGGSAHEAARMVCAEAVKATAEGHVGVNSALWGARDAFVEAVGDRRVGERRRGEGKAVAEWRAMLSGAIGKYGGDVADEDPCSELKGSGLWP